MSLSGFAKVARRRFLSTLLAAIALVASASFVFADPPPAITAKMFPAKLGSFEQVGRTREFPRDKASPALINDLPSEVLPISLAETEYASADGEKVRVAAYKFENDSAAYCQFTLSRRDWRDHGGAPAGRIDDVGTASVLIPGPGLMFFKGATLVTVTSENRKSPHQATELARLLAAMLDNGGGEIPVLVKHLPNWETVQGDALYAVSKNTLGYSVANQRIVKEVTFEGGTEAVVANYGQSQLLIVEFTTPQFAGDNDRRIVAKIQELKSLSQSGPTAYRRVGNYSVFVFNAPDEKTANELIDQVKYEQVIQWLGDDPHLYERIQRYFLQKTGGVVIAVLESSGLSVLLCLGVGGLFGALLFRRRRARQRGAEAYSDAGGMVRLNLDEATEGSDPSRLLQGSNKHG